MPNPIRSFFELRKAAAKPIATRARELLASVDDLEKQQLELSRHGNRRRIVEAHFKAKVEALTGPDGALAERVVLESDKEAREEFSQRCLGGRIAALPSRSLLKDYDTNLAAELAVEVANVSEMLRPTYQATGTEAELNDSAPLRAYRRELERALQRAAHPCENGDTGAVRTAFRGLLD